jgi:hypothetical protein
MSFNWKGQWIKDGDREYWQWSGDDLVDAGRSMERAVSEMQDERKFVDLAGGASKAMGIGTVSVTLTTRRAIDLGEIHRRYHNVTELIGACRDGEACDFLLFVKEYRRLADGATSSAKAVAFTGQGWRDRGFD